MLSLLIYIVAILFLVVMSMFIPIGNENSTVRRLPWVTFAIMALNVLIYYVTMPGQVSSMKEITSAATELAQFLERNEQLLADDNVRNKLVAEGLATKEQVDLVKEQFKSNPGLQSEYDLWLRSSEANQLREEFNKKVATLTTAREGMLWFKYGLAPNGKWKIYQLITSAFLHGGLLHLFGNMIFFFAIAFSLEDLWGRGIFLGFYLLGAAASCIPYIASPASVPCIGASGAISATMGAFLIRLPKSKIRLFFLGGLLSPIGWVVFLFFKKRSKVFIPGYIYMIAYFITQVISWYFDKRSGGGSGVGYSVHIAGFIFGAGFAFVMKATKTEETYVNPKIEAKVSFEAPAAVTQGLEMMDKGQFDMAERKMRSHLAQNHDSLEAILGLIQIYEKTSNYDQLNVMYGRLIRYHLSKEDKEAALYAYDNLLSAFPDKEVRVRIPVRDWMIICEYLREVQMNREASVEFERLAKAWPDDPNAVRASLQGAELALMSSEPERALMLFEMAQQMNPPAPFVNRIETGAEKCRKILQNRPDWKRKQPKPVVFDF
ncbi:MAG TPA: rhomboid family intramembrane serine protease [Blastocatellia bacterium]|nr:rhomboid family intramembrane serine protease [Blastocatellia bacterium]